MLFYTWNTATVAIYTTCTFYFVSHIYRSMQISIVSLYVYLLMNIYYIDRHNEVKALATTVLHSSASILTCHGAYTYVVSVIVYQWNMYTQGHSTILVVSKMYR